MVAPTLEFGVKVTFWIISRREVKSKDTLSGLSYSTLLVFLKGE